MHVIDHVRGDKLEVRRRRTEAGEIGDVGTAGLVAADVRVADGRVVLADVSARLADAVNDGRRRGAREAVARIALHVSMPGPTGCLDLIEQVVHAQVVDAIVGDALSACLLYTSDAADDLLCVDLGGR